ncbi:MAG TPA: hypothetical protein EYQ75_17835 [Planctomycetaceae bacterium]|nr:hypothetical protein [Planctomycetaceae bacterium]
MLKTFLLLTVVVLLGCSSGCGKNSPSEHGLAKGDNVIVIKDAKLAQDSGMDTMLVKGTKLTVSKVDGDKIWTNVLSPVTLGRHKSSAKAAEFSPNGKLIVSGGGSGDAKIWDVESKAEHGVLLGLEVQSNLTDIAFGPKGQQIAGGGLDGVLIWNVESQERIVQVSPSTLPHDIAFSPDGTLLAVAECGYHPDARKRRYVPCVVSVWNIGTGERTFALEGNRRDVHSVSFSPDGKTIASGGKDGSIRIWDTNTGEQLKTWSAGSSVADVVYLTDGKLIASTGDSGSVRLWQIGTGKIETTLVFSGTKGTALACSPDGALIACADYSGVVRLWNIEDGKLTLEFKAHTAVIQGLGFSRDGKKLVSASHDSSVKVWSIGTGEGLSGWVAADSLLKVID